MQKLLSKYQDVQLIKFIAMYRKNDCHYEGIGQHLSDIQIYMKYLISVINMRLYSIKNAKL